MKDLLSAPIETLVQDFDEMKHLLEGIQPQLPKVLQIKLWSARHLPFFRAKVEKAHRRIESCCSHASLKADIAKKCRLVNDKKVALYAKTDTSASFQRLDLLERKLEDLKERESEQPSGLSRTRKTIWPAQSRKQRTSPPS
jgi:hypothetical protein